MKTRDLIRPYCVGDGDGDGHDDDGHQCSDKEPAFGDLALEEEEERGGGGGGL